MRKFFRFEELGTNYRREIIAGVTTFVTMAYIILVNPAILAPAVSPDIVQQVARDQGVAEVTVTVEQAEGPVTVEMGRLDTYRAEVQAAVAPRFVKPALLVATTTFGWRSCLAGICVGGVLFVLYPLMKVITGRVQEVPTGMWVLSVLSLAFFAFYAY